MSVVAVVLAAGKGTRMKSRLVKVLHPLCGRPMVQHVVNNLRLAGIERIIVVVGFQADKVREELGDSVEYAVQEEQLGTGHAVMQTRHLLENHTGPILITYGDAPLYRSETFAGLIKAHAAAGAGATLLSVILSNPTGYGRIIRDEKGRFLAVVEERDATRQQAAIREVNSGTYVFESSLLFAALDNLRPENAQQEYYLTDVPALMRQAGEKIHIFSDADPVETLGINNRLQLARAEKILRDRIREKWMLAGVTMIDPASVFIDAEVELEPDVVLYPSVFLEGRTRVGRGAVIGPFTRLVDVEVGENTVITQSTVWKSELEANCTIGPYTYIRPGCHLEEGVKIGDFTEVKNSRVGAYSKIPHLSYVGDSHVGRKVNVGAGTITCNYDGQKKHQTIIGDEAFIGSNSNLVAPVEVGPCAYVAAGSTITKKVPAGALGVARCRQTNIPDWNERKRAEDARGKRD